MKKNSKTGLYESQYWHPAVTTDAVVFGFDDTNLNVLLIKRDNDPYRDTWALPGGFIREEDETAKLVKLDGLGMVDLLTLPHANKDSFNDEDINKESKDIDCYLISNKACVKVFNDDVSFMLIDDGFIDIVNNGKTEHIL